MAIALVGVLICAAAFSIADIPDYLTDEFIESINQKQNTWKAGRNFPPDTHHAHISKIAGGVLELGYSPTLPVMQHTRELILSLPDSFVPKDKWPNCPTLNDIRDQGSCGSCWAHGAVEAMTDRYCTFSNRSSHFYFSAGDLLTCCDFCGNGCEGGFSEDAWVYWQETGIVSGGGYNTSDGCRPYEFEPCEHHMHGNRKPCEEPHDTPECQQTCESSYNIDYDSDKHRGKSIYAMVKDEEQIKAELFKNGPVEATFTVYSDFLSYKSGVYKHVQGNEMGYHAVKMLGWGIENGTKYWLIANSWNTDWGDKGFFKILRGEDHCDIESNIIAGEPMITNET